MHERLYEMVVGRLEEEGLAEDVRQVVLTACRGEGALQELLEGGRVSADEALETDSGGPLKGVFLKQISVQGFRGIGALCALELDAGPGLTLVVGRNGSGKSSFSEGLEMLLTGDNSRWASRSKIWKEGWKNLHYDGEVVLEASFLVQREHAHTTVQRSWSQDGSGLADSVAWLQQKGLKRIALSEAGWNDALANYRPFLPYNELGAMFDAGPTKLFDAMSSVLGLGDLVDATEILRQARLSREKLGKEIKKELPGLLDQLEASPDERARRCLDALKGRSWDLETAARIVTGDDGNVTSESDIQVLRQLASLEAPPALRIEDHVRRLRRYSQELAAFEGSDLQKDRQVAQLLEESLNLHLKHGDMDCPVCSGGRIDGSWRERTELFLQSLRERIADYEQKLRAAREAFKEAKQSITHAPPSLRRGAHLGVDTSEVTEAFRSWTTLEFVKSPESMAEHLERHFTPLASSVEAVKIEALNELERRQNLWRPLASLLSGWLSRAREVERQESVVGMLKQAEKWLKDTSAEIRRERFEPVASRVSANWEQLRQQSNVDLNQILLEGSGTQRKVTLDVTVDGIPGVALGVMSQGELHSLALSLFLPRATLDESPFRFVVIDDPVQSMDPARVDGLARVLENCARDRQVVVFTHDARLVEAVKRLQIDATVLEVQRRTGSSVEIRPLLDPVKRYLADAGALVRSEKLPLEAAQRVVPGLCRMAIESVLADVYRRRRLSRGESLDSIELVLTDCPLNVTASLAFSDHPDKGGDVLNRLNKFGHWAATAYQACQKGSHGKFEGDLEGLVMDAGKLVQKLRRMS